MGFIGKAVAKLTGADDAAKATREAAEKQAEATRKASETAAASARESAAQMSRQQELQAGRNAAEGAAADALSKPMEVADVQLDEPTGSSSAGTARKKRATFGTGYSSGVNI